MEELKKPFLCKIGIHTEECYVGEFKVSDVRGPFDPDQNRTRTKDRWICAKCGRVTDRDPYWSYDGCSL